MDPFSEKEIKEAEPYGFILRNINGVPYCQTTCNICETIFTTKSTPGDKMPMICPMCSQK